MNKTLHQSIWQSLVASVNMTWIFKVQMHVSWLSISLVFRALFWKFSSYNRLFHLVKLQMRFLFILMWNEYLAVTVSLRNDPQKIKYSSSWLLVCGTLWGGTVGLGGRALLEEASYWRQTWEFYNHTSYSVFLSPRSS